ncbi:hypothetical protein ASB62_01300 [Chlorobium limicola]|uniref:Uncharacterized protein n=1 Tax=Chlorobium limicola TaxID=1092 RepID=A0A101JU72_CHLLI|nr:hypothetical protein ASB62_01300 [Chlorobium limicola]
MIFSHRSFRHEGASLYSGYHRQKHRPYVFSGRPKTSFASEGITVSLRFGRERPVDAIFLAGEKPWFQACFLSHEMIRFIFPPRFFFDV